MTKARRLIRDARAAGFRVAEVRRRPGRVATLATPIGVAPAGVHLILDEADRVQAVTVTLPGCRPRPGTLDEGRRVLATYGGEL